MPVQKQLSVAVIALLATLATAQIGGSFFDTPCAQGIRNITFSNNDLCDDVYDVYKAVRLPAVEICDQGHGSLGLFSGITDLPSHRREG